MVSRPASVELLASQVEGLIGRVCSGEALNFAHGFGYWGHDDGAVDAVMLECRSLEEQ
jgi:hypothetical protein